MKKFVGVALLATATLALTGCGKDPHANDKCVQSHTYTTLIPITHHTGNVTFVTFIPMTQHHCDKWVPKGGK